MKVMIGDVEYVPVKKEEAKPAEPLKALEFNISVQSGRVYGGAVATEKNWNVYHTTKQECKEYRVRQVMPGDLILTPTMLQDLWQNSAAAVTLDAFIEHYRNFKK